MKNIDIIPANVAGMHVFPAIKDCEVWLKHNLKIETGGFEKMVEELRKVKKAKVAFRM